MRDGALGGLKKLVGTLHVDGGDQTQEGAGFKELFLRLGGEYCSCHLDFRDWEEETRVREEVTQKWLPWECVLGRSLPGAELDSLNIWLRNCPLLSHHRVA